MEAVAESEQKTYVVVLRARSSARFLPEGKFEVFFNDIPGSSGPVRFQLRTRWVDEGHEAPMPRELWIEARGPAPSLDRAAAAFGATGRFFSNLLALTANTSVEVPEVHVAYDATPGTTEREFLEVFVPDERGHPREGRVVRAPEFGAVLEAFGAMDDPARINRAIQQYALALRYWYFGGEWLALAHLYMAAETLTDAVLADRYRTEGVDAETLADRLGIDTSDQAKWRHDLQVWARREVIFSGDNQTYRDARRASDGIEHGFLELDEVNRHAQTVTAVTFGYIRNTILTLLGLSRMDHADLYQRPPRDVSSLRKMIRGQFVGDGGDPALPNEEYPYLEWNSAVKTVQREGDTFRLSFQEKFTVRCAPGYGFRGQALEARGRVEPGAEPIRLSEVAAIVESAASSKPALDPLYALMRRAKNLAEAAAAPGTSAGIPPMMLNIFSIFSEQVALFEAIEVLIRDNRPVEAMVLLRSLILGACQLEVVAHHPNRQGAALRLKLDAIERQAKMFESEPMIVTGARDQIARFQQKAIEKGITIPEVLPDVRETAFYTKSTNSLNFVQEVALPSDFAAMFHAIKDDEGNQSLHTRVADSALLTGVGTDAVEALTASAVALAKALDWPIGEDSATEIDVEVKRLSDEAEASSDMVGD